MYEMPRIRDLDNSDFNPFISDDIAWGGVDDPYPTIARMRREKSVHKIDYREIFTGSPDPTFKSDEKYTILGYEAVSGALMSPENFSNSLFMDALGPALGRSIVMMDPPEHSRYRRLFQKAFLPQIVAQWQKEIIDPVIAGLIDDFRGDGKADLVSQFTSHFPFQIVYRQLDLPAEDCATFHKLAMAQNFMPSHPHEAIEAGSRLGEYFERLIDIRSEKPGIDLISLFATAEVEGERLPCEIAISFVKQLVNAAGDTTFRATGTLLAALLTNPDMLEALRKDRSLIPAAIEETLRWEGPVIFTWRSAARDVVLDGVTIPEGAAVNIVTGSANRDETRFPDPDKFDIFRKSTHRHLGFSTGPHVCIGQHLARLEMTRALEAFLDRLPNLRLDPDYPEPRATGFQLRSPRQVRVLFDA